MAVSVILVLTAIMMVEDRALVLSLPGCTDFYTNQPPSVLQCDPILTEVTLQCATGSASSPVNWYWAVNVSDAGVRGEKIVTGSVYSVAKFNPHQKHLKFEVLNSTLGYYWCEIDDAVNVSLRTSTITPICIPQQLPVPSKCNESYILGIHHVGEECAATSKPTVFTRPPLPQVCSQQPIATTHSITIKPTVGYPASHPVHNTVTALQTMSVVATMSTLVPHATPHAEHDFSLSWIIAVLLGSLFLIVSCLLMVTFAIILVLRQKIKLLRNEADLASKDKTAQIEHAAVPLHTRFMLEKAKLANSTNGTTTTATTAVATTAVAAATTTEAKTSAAMANDVPLTRNRAYNVVPILEHKPLDRDPSYEQIVLV